MALKWCHFLIVRQAINEFFMDVNFWMSLRKGHATAGNQTNKNFKKQTNKNRAQKTQSMHCCKPENQQGNSRTVYSENLNDAFYEGQILNKS